MASPTDAAARGIPVLHIAFVIGLAMAGAVFFVLLQVRGPLIADTPIFGFMFAGVALVLLGVAFGALSPRVPPRRPDQSPETYWLMNDARGSVVILWAIVDAAGMLAWVGYLLSGQIAAAGVALVSIAGLIMLSPSRLENRG